MSLRDMGTATVTCDRAAKTHALHPLSRPIRRGISHRCRVLPLQIQRLGRHHARVTKLLLDGPRSSNFEQSGHGNNSRIKQKTESVSHQTEDITDATYVTFGQLVVRYGGWSWRPAVQGAQKCASMCARLGPPWVFRDGFSGLLMFRVVSVKNQERIHKAWSLVTKAEMQIGDCQPCLFSDDSFAHVIISGFSASGCWCVHCEEAGRCFIIKLVLGFFCRVVRCWRVICPHAFLRITSVLS